MANPDRLTGLDASFLSPATEGVQSHVGCHARHTALAAKARRPSTTRGRA